VNVVAPNAVTNREFTRALKAALARPAFCRIPAWAARLALGEMADALLLASAHVRPKKLLSAGYQFRCENLDDTLRQMLGKPRP
jgi:uncharacterized protein